MVEQVIRQKLPPGAQKSEFLLEHGMIDSIVSRCELKGKLSQFLTFLTGNEREYLTLHAARVNKKLPEELQELLMLADDGNSSPHR